ncbi:MAG TPA: cupin domain-containing protein [Longimicrobium sp.]|nr:cupin domain-containing protein [Longimicrobium sp.]
MAYTVKDVSGMSGISVRTLHFYDETGLLKPASYGVNGYRYYEEPQLLMLQQILFYRELGLGLKQIKEIMGRAGFQTAGALESHRKVLQKNVARTHRLIDTIDRTLEHLNGRTTMQSEEMFAGFNVAAGEDRFGENVLLGGEPNDCKVSARDTGGALCIFEFTGSGGGPRHLHHEQDEWIYVMDGGIELHIGEQQLRLGAGESAFVPRTVPHVWVCAGGGPCRILNVYQPAGNIEEFFRELGTFTDPLVHEALSLDELRQLFQSHGMKLVGPPLYWDEYLAGK